MKISTPRTIEAATALLARYADTAATIAAREAERQAAIAATNAAADAIVAPMAAELEQARTALQSWWLKAGAQLLGPKRKSLELGGCKVGTRLAAQRVEFTAGDDKAALAATIASPHKGKATVLKRVLDKGAIATLLRGKSAAAEALRALGFKIAGGEDVFFVSRVDSADAKVSAQ